MIFLKDKKILFLIFGSFVIYFLFRLPNLTLQPIFADEGIYIRWAQLMRSDPTLRFISLSDGKTPLFMWLMIPLFKIFQDPLFAGRLLSVISGFFTLLGGLFLGWRFFNKKIGVLSAYLIAIVPFMVFFDRMALVDSMLATFSIWALNLSLLLIKSPKMSYAMFLGYMFGGAILTKPPGVFNLIALPFTLVSFNWDKPVIKKISKLLSFWFIALVITFIIYSILKFAPNYININTRNNDYIFSLNDILKNPLNPFIPHIGDVLDWLVKFISIPVLFLLSFGIVKIILKRDKIGLTVLFWGLIPLIIQMVFYKVFTARYILFSIPPLLVLASYGLVSLSIGIKRYKKLIVLLLLTLIVIYSGFFNFFLLTDPIKAPLPAIERRTYLEDWTAGYGFVEIAKFLEQKSENQDIVVGTEGSFGTLPDGLQIYLNQNKRVIFQPGGAVITADLRSASITHPTFFVSNKSRYAGNNKNVILLKEFPKATNPSYPQDAILLFQILP